MSTGFPAFSRDQVKSQIALIERLQVSAVHRRTHIGGNLVQIR